MAEFASRGVGNAGLTTGIIGTALGLLNGGIGKLLGNGSGTGWNSGCAAPACSEGMPVDRYEAAQAARIAQLETEVKLRDANTYTDQKLLEVYRYVDGRLGCVEGQIAQQAVYNATNTAQLSCMAQQIAVLNGLTKTVIPATSICPEVMPRYNSWTAPTTDAAAGA